MSIPESIIPERPNDAQSSVQNTFPFKYIVLANGNGSGAKSGSNAEQDGLDAAVNSQDSTLKSPYAGADLISTMTSLIPHLPIKSGEGFIVYYDENERIIAALKNPLQDLARVNYGLEMRCKKRLEPLGDTYLL